MRRMPPTLPGFVIVYGLLYAAFGVQSPFLPALLREQRAARRRDRDRPRCFHCDPCPCRSRDWSCCRPSAPTHIDPMRMCRRGGRSRLWLPDDAWLRELADRGVATCGDACPDRASVRRAGNHCGTRERVRGQTAFRLWMAACVWIGSIHHWHDAERLGRRESRLAKHNLDQRDAPCHWRHRGSILPKLPVGDVARNGFGLRSCAIGLCYCASPSIVVCSSSQPWSREVMPCTMRFR